MTPRLTKLSIALTFLLASASAAAQQSPVDHAFADVEQADFAGAHEALATAFADATLPAETYARALFLDGALDMVEGRSADGRRKLAGALALNPGLSPPELLGPDVARLVTTLRSARGSQPASVRLRLPTAPHENQTATVRAAIQASPDGLVDHLIVRCEGDPSFTAEGEREAELALSPRGETLRCRAVALASTGQELFGADANVPLIPSAAVGTLAPDERAGSDGRPVWFWAAVGGGGAVVVAAVVLGVVLASGGGSGEPRVGAVGVSWNLR